MSHDDQRILMRSFGEAFLFILLISVGIESAFAREDSSYLGSGVVTPDTAIAGKRGTWRVTYTVGDKGIETGGGVEIQFYKNWNMAGENWPNQTWKDEQTNDPSGHDFLSAHASRPGTRVRLSIVKGGLDGQFDRGEETCVLKVEGEPLRKGDTIVLVFARTTAPVTSESEPVGIAVDRDGSGKFIPIKSFPELYMRSAAPQELRVLVESQAIPGKPVRVRVVALDRFFNAANGYNGRIHFSSDDKRAILPADYTFTKADRGTKEFEVTFETSGVHTLVVRDDSPLAWYWHGIQSNPVNVGKAFAPYNVYWGDMHSHSGASKDGFGKQESAFWYAKNVSHLDFYTLTDHAAGDKLGPNKYGSGLLPGEWANDERLVESYSRSGHFVAYLACEWSGPSPYDHHDVFYRNLDGHPYGEDKYRTMPEIWKLLKPGDAFTIPHHTGLFGYTVWPYSNDGINDTLQPAVEIYSHWGSSEYYGNSMSYERMNPGLGYVAHKGPDYARDGWANGQWLGVVGGSDNHLSHPGTELAGLTAVCTLSLNRDSIFDAILKRHTYVTTGQRILLNFSINGHMMGDRFGVKPGVLPKLTVKAAGTFAIDYVEVMKYDGGGWRVLARVNPNSALCTFRFIDRTFTNKESALYFVRVKQEDIIHNSPVMAWSSPIWVTNENHPWWETRVKQDMEMNQSR